MTWRSWSEIRRMNSVRSRRSAKSVDPSTTVRMSGLSALKSSTSRVESVARASRNRRWSRTSRARSERSSPRRLSSSARLASRSRWRTSSRPASVVIFAWRRLIRLVYCAMSLDSVFSAPFLRPILSRVRSIFPLSSSSLLWDGVAAVDPRGRAPQRATGTATHTMRTMRRRIGVGAGYGTPTTLPDRRVAWASACTGILQDALTLPAYTRAMAQSKVALRADTGLQARMLITVFLLGALYVVLIAALFASGASGVTIFVVAAGLFLFQLFASDKIALATMGVQKVSPQEAPELHAMIERLCVQADLPKPTIGIVNTTMPNAFAMGRSQKSATVVATTGILELLSPAELEGVMAHELAHVRHRDVMIMTIASFFASIAALILQFGFFFGGGGGYGDDEDSPGILPLILVSLAVYVVSFFLMQALSRYREFAADRGAAQLTG